MTDETLDHVLDQIRHLVGAREATTHLDRDLLDQFVLQRDETAFAALVQRHGPMVLGVCRRLLRNPHDAEDACQAVFLVLARKAASIRKGESVGGWLHAVACRVAGRLRRQTVRRRSRETPIKDVALTEGADPGWREIHALLDAELRRLPERFQAPLLLCYLQGMARDEAAQVLGWSLGALRGRLERGREMLRRRLARRGLTLSAALFASLLSQQAAPAALPSLLELGLVKAAAQAGGMVSGRVAALAAGLINSMWMTKMKNLSAVLLLIGALTSGAALTWGGARTGPPPEDETAPAAAGPKGPDEELPGSAKTSGRKTDQASREARAESRRNLQHLALAMHNYHDCYADRFPPPAIYAAVPGGGAPPPGGAPAGGGGGPAPTAGGGTEVPRGGTPGRPPGGRPGGGLPGGGGSAPSVLPGGAPGGPPPEPTPGGIGAGPAGGGAAGGKKTPALLSWRVALLPFLDEMELYKQFRLDEPWDGPHNKKLLHKMPKVFAHPKGIGAGAGMTYYQVFVGEHAAFEKHRAMRMADFTDGLSNTILIVEGGTPVPWTKPEDLHYDADEPVPSVGGAFRDVFLAAMGDGAVRTFEKSIHPEKLRALITRDRGDAIDPDRGPAAGGSPARPLKHANHDLRAAVEELRAAVEHLKSELSALEKERAALAAEDAEADQLRQESEELRQLGRKLADEAAQLKKEIQALKKDREKRRHRSEEP